MAARDGKSLEPMITSASTGVTNGDLSGSLNVEDGIGSMLRESRASLLELVNKSVSLQPVKVDKCGFL